MKLNFNMKTGSFFVLVMTLLGCVAANAEILVVKGDNGPVAVNFTVVGGTMPPLVWKHVYADGQLRSISRDDGLSKKEVKKRHELYRSRIEAIIVGDAVRDGEGVYAEGTCVFLTPWPESDLLLLGKMESFAVKKLSLKGKKLNLLGHEQACALFKEIDALMPEKALISSMTLEVEAAHDRAAGVSYNPYRRYMEVSCGYMAVFNSTMQALLASKREAPKEASK